MIAVRLAAGTAPWPARLVDRRLDRQRPGPTEMDVELMRSRRRPWIAVVATALLLTPATVALARSQPGAVAQSAGPPAASRFAHPGVVVGRPQLDFVRAKVKGGAQPWKSAYD